MSRSFEYFKALFYALFFAFFFLVIIAAIIQRARGKEVEESPLIPWLFILGGGWLLLLFIWLVLWMMGLVPPINLRQYWWA